MKSGDPREAVLKRLVREARAEKPPEIDWSGVEQRLLRQATRGTPQPRRASHPLAWAALAVAAAAALWLASGPTHQGPAPAPQASVESSEPLRQSGDSLAIGTRVVAKDREVSVDHVGRATWTLSPESSAILAGKGERLTVHLERGSVLSEVVPNPKPETFVVEAAGARIAVHGTVFRVTLLGERVLVEVREGTVAVGAQGAEAAFFLKAPAHGDFATDGRSGRIDGHPQGDATERRRAPLRPTPLRAPSVTPPSSAAVPAPSAELPSEPSINDIEVGIASVVEATSDCFRRYTSKNADGVEITAHTALSLKIADSGAVLASDFQPPLSPDAEKCARASISQIRFAASKQGADVTRLLELKR